MSGGRYLQFVSFARALQQSPELQELADLQNFSKLAPEVQNAYLTRLFGEDAPARYAADIRVNAELLGLLERQRDQLFTEDLVPDDPAKARVQFAAFRQGLLESYERDAFPEKK